MNYVQWRKIRLWLLPVLMILTVFLSGRNVYAADSAGTKGRMINVVYDDSGSMVRDQGQFTPRWSQAKYAMEVFCAMMGEQDTMNIYPMSKEGKKGLTLKGTDTSRVQQVHDMNANYHDTPFATVTSAGKALQKADDGYEKWLIVITDGLFDDGATAISTVQNKLNDYNEEGIRTIYLAIGESAATLSDNGENGYAYSAADGQDVLTKVTAIANQIFEHQILGSSYVSQNGDTYTLSVDIPTDKVIVFAQGDDVTIGEDMTLNGSALKRTAGDRVKYSDVKPLNSTYADAVTDTSLNGMVATYSAPSGSPYESGQFQIRVTGATTVEFYYEPGVEVNCELKYNGTVVSQNAELYSGDYEVSYNFINPLTGAAVQSELLSSAEFAMKATNNDSEVEVDSSGKVHLEEGAIDITVTAELPGNVVLKSSKEYKVLPEPIELEIAVENPKENYNPATMGEEAEPTVLRVSNKATGELLSDEECQALKLEVASMDGVEWNITRADEAGTFELRPVLTGEDFDAAPVGDNNLNVQASYQMDDQYAYGTSEFTMKVDEYTGNALQIEIVSPETGYTVRDLEEEEPMTVTVMKEDPQSGTFVPLTEEEWDAAKLKAKSDKSLKLTVAKGTEVGTWTISPGYPLPPKTSAGSGDVVISVSGTLEYGSFRYSGSGTEQITVQPMSPCEIILDLLPWIIAALIAIWLLIGYTIKKNKIPSRKLNPRCKYRRQFSSKRKISKDFLSVILPYVPQRATVHCNNTNFECMFPNLRIEATGKSSFRILNPGKIDLTSTKICSQTFPDKDTLATQRFQYGNFDIKSLDRRTKKPKGVFTFK